MRDQLQASGIPPTNYIGQEGLYGRSDLAGLNLAQYPSILVELRQHEEPRDSALLESAEGRQKYADALVRGVAAFLATEGPGALAAPLHLSSSFFRLASTSA